VVIWIFEDKAFYSFARTCVARRAQNHEESHLPEHAHRAANAVLGRSAGANFHVEQVLLPTLPHIGQSPIARSGSFLAKTHRLPSVLAFGCPAEPWRRLESAMIRA